MLITFCLLLVTLTTHRAQPVVMSHEALPIDRARFAEALESLPLDALHSKVAELRNNMNHLRYSNEQMVPFADEGDQGKSTFPYSE